MENQYKRIWQLLEKYNFDFDIDKYEELICIICKKIMRNASQSLCGCRYCTRCINYHLLADNKSCPGNSGDCAGQLLNLTGVLHVDHSTNRDISMMIVTCPLDICRHECPLESMETHIQSHNICPFSNIGCQVSVLCDDLAQHLMTDCAFHMGLLVEYFYNLSGELVDLRAYSQQIDTEMKATLDQAKSQSTCKFENIDQKINQLLMEKEDLNKENSIMKEEINGIRNELIRTQNELSDLRLELREKEKEWGGMRQISKEIGQKYLKQVQEELEKQRTDLNYQIDQASLSRLLNETELRKSIDKIMVQQKDINQSFNWKRKNEDSFENIAKRKRLKSKQSLSGSMADNISSENVIDSSSVTVRLSDRSLVPSDDVLKEYRNFFTIKLVNFRPLYEDAKGQKYKKIDFPPFYTSDRYRLCFHLYPNGAGNEWNKYLSLGISVTAGDFDEELVWPRNHSVRLSLSSQIDPPSQIYYLKPSSKITCTFNRLVPPDSQAAEFRTHRFIRLSTLFANQSIYTNDSLFIGIGLDPL